MRRCARLIKLNVFPNAYTKIPAEQIETDWPGLCDRLEALVQTTAEPGADKRTLPAWTAAEMATAYNVNANITALTALPIDVDSAPDWLIERCAASGLDLFVYTTPSDPNPDGSRRLRIVARLSRPILPSEVEHARLALAELLGIGPGAGVETAKAVSQVMFAGALAGTPERVAECLEGAPLDVDALMATPLALAWKRTPAKGTAQPAPTASANIHPKLAERIAAVVAIVAPHYDHDRHEIVRPLASWLAANDWNDTAIADLFRQLPSDQIPFRISEALKAAEQKRSGAVTAGWAELRARLGDADAARLEACAVPRFGDALERMRARREAGEAVFAPPKPNAKTLLLRSREDASFLLIWEGDARGYRRIAEKNLQIRIRELGYLGSFVEEKDGELTPDKMVAKYGGTYLHTSHAFGNSITVFDNEDDGRVTVGYPLRPLPAVFDRDVDEWLRALGGHLYPELESWIAACAQRNINRLCACLILVGRADVGKSLFGNALARMWRARPVRAALLAKQFNGGLLRCPIVVDEESQLFGTRELSTKTFREMIQATARPIEPKNKEEIELIGGLRLIVPCNEIADLKFADMSGPSVIKAVSDRLLVIDATEREECCKEPLARLRPAEAGWELDLDRVSSHMAWLCDSAVLPVKRFIGSGGDSAEAAILAGHLSADPEIWESLRLWVDSGGSAGPWYTHNGALVVDDTALTTSVESAGKGYSLERVRKALEPLSSGPRYQARLAGGLRLRVIPLDRDRLIRAMPDTAPRKGMGSL